MNSITKKKDRKIMSYVLKQKDSSETEEIQKKQNM